MKPLLVATALMAAGLTGCQNELDDVVQIDPEPKQELGLYLDLSTPAEHLVDLGTFEVLEVEADRIRFSSSAGHLCDPVYYDRVIDNFNFDGLYQVDADGQTYLFRHHQQDCRTSESELTWVNWANGVIPAPGTWDISVVEKDIEQDGHTTVVTIGDSNTWYLHAQTLRARIQQHRPGFAFIGSRTDSYGYGHDAEGGDDTTDVLARMDTIPAADAYLMNIGTNDRTAPGDTVDNIKTITAALLAKQDNVTVYLCTIIPRADSFDAKNQDINQELREWAQTQPSIRLVDIDSEFRALPDWESYLLPDLVHPTDEGYVELARIIADRL